LKKEFGKVEGVVRAKRKPYIPVVLSREEIDRVIGKMKDPYDLVVKLLYGCGLRLSECMKLRIHCFNFDHQVLTVHDGKGKKDRTTQKLLGRSSVRTTMIYTHTIASTTVKEARSLLDL
jgi:site-specific recombinase XerD